MEQTFLFRLQRNHVTVNDFDGIIQVRAPNSGSTVFLSGALGTYGQSVTVNANENFTSLQKNDTTTYATVPRTCNGGTTLLNSGQPISGDLNTIQFCVPAGQVSRLQFSVPPSLQNMTSLYIATSNSSAVAILGSGENKIRPPRAESWLFLAFQPRCRYR